ncbi:MAG: class I SAM-dependent methyltransferase [Chloroflexi bacterium]|nr:class I SAM-dependent methyltransferase [Chloroflexota bacterium]MBT7081214.1 class I SAM-dependent methyltransferase [Chloroflexota bacterium]MBT7290269.1 class I SAM-dependent methyltransferase [Chloroflexota bacterium]
MLRYLRETDPLREQLTLNIIKTLDLLSGSNGLDVGCGGGTQALMLANAVGPQGHVTGLDISPELLEYANGFTAKKGLSDRVSFREGNFAKLPFADNTFDWLWSSDCVGPLPTTNEIARVVKPGGSLNIVFWSYEQLLPGYPILEAKLKATSAGLAPFAKGSKPEAHHIRMLSKFKEMGLTELQASTFVETVHAPLSDEMRTAMTDIIEMRWPGVETELSKDDFELFQCLTDPDSPDFVLNMPDYYGFYTYSVFKGKVPIS